MENKEAPKTELTIVQKQDYNVLPAPKDDRYLKMILVIFEEKEILTDSVLIKNFIENYKDQWHNIHNVWILVTELSVKEVDEHIKLASQGQIFERLLFDITDLSLQQIAGLQHHSAMNWIKYAKEKINKVNEQSK